MNPLRKIIKEVLQEHLAKIQPITLQEAILRTSKEDVYSIAEWLNKPIKNISFYFKLEPISIFSSQIEEMESTYSEFPDDEERTQQIYKLLQQGNEPRPVFVELKDKDKFILEGRHRIVAFKWIGLNSVPVLYVK